MRAKTINEEQNFERGIDPKASMGIGGVNFQETFDETYEEWVSTLRSLNGKTISGEIEKHWMDSTGRQKDELKKRTVAVREMDKNPSLESMGGGRAINWKVYFYGKDGSRYSFGLDQKISIQTSVREAFERGTGPRRALQVGGLSFQEGFTKDFKKVLDKWFDLLQTLEGKTISAISVQHGSNEDGKSWVSAKTTHKIKVQKVLEPGIRGAHAAESDEGMIILSQWVVGEDDYTYELDLRKKIYIENES